MTKGLWEESIKNGPKNSRDEPPPASTRIANPQPLACVAAVARVWGSSINPKLSASIHKLPLTSVTKPVDEVLFVEGSSDSTPAANVLPAFFGVLLAGCRAPARSTPHWSRTARKTGK